MRWIMAIWLALAGVAVAAPVAPIAGAGITDLQVGVLCSPRVLDRTDAPETKLGYTNTVKGPPSIRFEQQIVPAALGISFGVMFTSDRVLTNVRNLTYRPGSTQPDVYYSQIDAAPGRYRGFGFEFPEELELGLWRLESWQGDQLLFRAEFDVVPEASLPEFAAQCQGMS